MITGIVRVCGSLRQLARGLEAVHARHHDVHQDQVRVQLAGHADAPRCRRPPTRSGSRCCSSAFCMTCTSVGESSTISTSATGHPPGAAGINGARGFDRAQQLLPRERLGQVVLGADDAAARTVEQAVLARQHDDRDRLEDLVVLDQRAGLVAVEPRHHDVHEDDVRLVVGDLRQRVEAVHGREHLAALLGEQRLGRPADGLAVVDDQHLQARQPGPAGAGCGIFHALEPPVGNERRGPRRYSARLSSRTGFNILDAALPLAGFDNMTGVTGAAISRGVTQETEDARRSLCSSPS